MVGRFISDFRQDWQGQWLSLALAVLIMLTFSQGWVSPLFGYSTEQSPMAGAVIRNIYYPIYLCAFVLIVFCYRRLFSAVIRTPLLLILVGLCALSALWSIDPSTTVRRTVALSMTVLAGYAIAARFSWTRLIEVVAIAHLILIVGSLFMALALPDKGRMTSLFIGAWRGVFSEKNNLGAVMSSAFIICMAAGLHVPKRRLFWFAAAAVAVGLVVMSTSKTSLVTLMLGAGALGFIWLARKGPVIGIVLVWLAVTTLIVGGSVMIMMPDEMLGLLGKDASLTGRTHIWAGIDYVMQTRPWTGYGFGAVWTLEGEWTPLARISDVAGFRAYHAHSCWYEVWLALGNSGLIVWALLFASFWFLALYRTWRGDGGYLALPFITIYSLMSVTESIALSWNHLRWCIFVIIFVKICLPKDAPEDVSQQKPAVDVRQRLYI
ncbi:O-antigen ligase family protein [Asticcacaulis tiandongensis]|uniref:O-antigen ligase family protein n=1 Tax=Asticcacaulis tiandongensis TaxID=2565365 RepID=UPI001129B508|nr:O-antigen ligase [Asticcacaulis tiandongensis]